MIGLVVATMLEASPLIRDLSLTEQETDPFLAFGNDHIRIIISGVGKANAAMACAYLIQTCRPACICNVGASGATDTRCRLGETYHITKVIEPDRPNMGTGAPEMCLPDVLAGFPTAILATHDKPIHEPAEREEVAMRAQLVDMEGASIVQTSRRFHTRCFLFKFVSDTSDHRESVDVIRNMRLYRDGFSRFIIDSVLPELATLSRDA